MNIVLPEPSLVVLIGPSGAGKSTWARERFAPTEIVSSDACRGMVADDENSMAATGPAFELAHFIVRKRLEAHRLTVFDATNVQRDARRPLVALARELHVLPCAIVLNMPAKLCQARNALRPNRAGMGAHVVRNHLAQLRRGLRGLKREGFRYVYRFNTPEELAAVESVERRPLWNDCRADRGPFDIIGDVHGCAAELRELIERLGYGIGEDGAARHPQGRRLVFVGDLVDRGPDPVGVLKLVMANVAAGAADCVPGNHDVKLLKWLHGKKVQLAHGLAETTAAISAEPEGWRRDLAEFIHGRTSHYVYDGGRLVVAHAGLPAAMHGRASGAVRQFCLFGETTGERDEFGLPERLDWAADYRGDALVVYGHTPFQEPRWLNNTVNIDTGCAFGGALTALRWPEREIVSVAAQKEYAAPARPLRDVGAGGASTPQQEHDALLRIEDVRGKHILHGDLLPSITIQAEHAAAALEAASRFGDDPRWLIHLPPTMSPVETSAQDGWLERPEEAFDHYAKQGAETLICEEKHMGSRALVILCRSAEAAARRFGLPPSLAVAGGRVISRSGRPFFPDAPETETALLDRVRTAAGVAGLWAELETDWMLLDCELMPWSAKARGLLAEQYAPVGAAAEAHTAEAAAALAAAAERADLGDDESAEIAAMQGRAAARIVAVGAYRAAYRPYCWPVEGLRGLRLAPFHLLASEGAVHTDRDHRWHMGIAERLAAAEAAAMEGSDKSVQPLLMATLWREVELADPSSRAAVIAWWEELTAGGGEGFVVKPLDFITRASSKNAASEPTAGSGDDIPVGSGAGAPRRGRALQPALKVRGREYLRIIYGPEYLEPANLERLKKRGISRKRGLAMRQFDLGIQALRRFTAREPLRRVHECVFGIIALNADPVDPRL